MRLFSISGKIRGRAFNAGIETRAVPLSLIARVTEERVSRAAPILHKFFAGKDIEWVRGFCEGIGWKIEEIKSHESADA